ncbi:MAG: hypothetical protein KGI50_07425 [Patescibacteria group bacterium]|nr:hypothetical protein [Patescibacteria group bacterium]MDE2438787.1 hypothetical protein [Patescibacteria group bacterium]
MSKRSIKINETQAKEIRLQLERGRALTHALENMLYNLVERAIEDEAECWDEIYKLANANRKVEKVSVDYVNMEIIVEPFEGK